MLFWELIKDSITLDIFDINFLYGSEELGLLSLPSYALSSPSVIRRIGSFVWHFIESLNHTSKFKPERISPKGIAFCFGTINQRNSLAPIVNLVNNPCLVGLDFYNRLELENAKRFPATLAYLVSFFFFPLVVFKFLKAKGYQKKSFYFAFDSYWLTYGCYLISRFWLRRMSLAGVVVANDHNMAIRSLIRAAKTEHIPTFYIQHASVTDKFPALSFDFALLDGMDALQKYERAGVSSTKVFLVGMLKADAYYRQINVNTSAQAIGVCTSRLDPISQVEQLCKQICQEFLTLPVILRPHPSDRRVSIWIDLARKYHMELSESKNELSFDFFKRVDMIIAGDSNIHLEAALMNVFPLYYDFEQVHRDYYGFQRNGLVEYVAEPQDVCNRLKELSQHKPSVRMRARPYCATVGTPYDGRSSELASVIINKIASNGQVNMSQWKRIPGVKLEAYEMAAASTSACINA